MPHSQTILRASSVAFSMSLPAPVVMWPRIELLGGAAAEQDREVVLEEPILVVGVAIVDRHLLREPERHAARDDRDLVHRVGAGEQLRDERVARTRGRRCSAAPRG